MDENNKIQKDSYTDDLKKALLYSTSIILAMWILSLFIK